MSERTAPSGAGSLPDSAALVARATAWRDQDPDGETRDALSALIDRAEAGDAAALGDLHDRFDGRLEFGTAGLRGELGPGSRRMNRVLVGQAAAGLAAYLVSQSPGVGRPADGHSEAGQSGAGHSEAGQSEASIVIGYDGRKNSDVFARDTAEIMAGAGVRAILLPRALPTPVLAFAVRHLDVSAGVMVTASHNPPRDNGYKVYLGDADQGSQIVGPVDGVIAELIEKAATGSVLDLPRSDDYATAGDDLVTDYVRLTAAVAGTASAAAANQPRVVYTALHGVGWEVARRVFATAGFTEPIPVADQVAPDAAFPTVEFPNPEEPGAMDLSFATAGRVDADLVIANDPDADRLAVAIPVGPTSDPASWRRLSGNEVGALLGWRAAERLRAAGPDGPRTLAASIVSSPALAEVARQYDLPYVDTLTGFKWVSRVEGLVFGYEEALGYLVDPAKVRDKDGISAAVDFLALTSELAAAGSSIEQHLREFDERFGAFASAQVSLRVSDLADIPRLTGRIRATPPSAIGGIPVVGFDDFADGVEGFPPGDILRFRLDAGSSDDGAGGGAGAGAGAGASGGARVIVRPSGTEPKLKVYIDAWSTEGDAASRRATADAVVARLDEGVREILR